MKITAEQSELICSLNDIFKTSDEISTILDIPKSAIIKHLKNLKRKLITSKNFYNVQIKHDYFSCIDSPEKAYLLGVLASDGNISANMIRLRIHPKDIEMIHFMAKEINYLKEPRINKTSYGTLEAGLSIRSTLMKEDLFKLGFSHNKTYSDLFIPLSEELTRFYLLGLFDGDGSVFYTMVTTRTEHRFGETREKYRFSYTGNTITGTKIGEYLKTKGLDLKMYPLKKNPKICSLQVSRNSDMTTLYNYLYDGHNLGLKRKRDIFEQAVQFYK